MSYSMCQFPTTILFVHIIRSAVRSCSALTTVAEMAGLGSTLPLSSWPSCPLTLPHHDAGP